MSTMFFYFFMLPIAGCGVLLEDEIGYRLILVIIYIVNFAIAFTTRKYTTTTRLIVAYGTIIGSLVSSCLYQETIWFGLLPLPIALVIYLILKIANPDG